MLDVFIQKYFESITMRYTGETSRQSYRFVGNIKVTDHVKMGKITSRAKFQAKMSVIEIIQGPGCPVHPAGKFITQKSIKAIINPAHFFYCSILQTSIFSAGFRQTSTEQNIGDIICFFFFRRYYLEMHMPLHSISASDSALAKR